MNNRDKWLWFGGGSVLALILFTTSSSWEPILKDFLVDWEGFRSAPYWDNKQWSWGYGTRVPGSIDNPAINPGGTITREKAMQDLISHAKNDEAYLRPLIDVRLNPHQWAALLSFAYNLGDGNADNLVANINSGDLEALEHQWNLYIYSNGQPDRDLIDRRAAEFALFTL